MSTTYALYRFFGANNELLYIGLTSNPGARWADHRKEKPWWHHVSTVTVEHHPSLEAVAAAEREAIRSEKPIHNSVHASTEAADAARDRLSAIASAHARAKQAEEDVRNELRAAVQEAVLAGVSESEAARASGVTRVTVRSWIGK